MSNNNLFDFFLENAKKILYPEEWINIDLQLSKSELIAMLMVDRNKGIIMSQIADYINVPMSTATSIIDRLVKKDLLKRERHEIDRRIVVISLTDEGSLLINDIKDKIFKYINLVENVLTEDEKKTLINIFIKVVNVINSEKTEENKNEEKIQINKINIE